MAQEHERGGGSPGGLTTAERDRRWSAIRAAMGKRDLACLIVWGSSAKWDSKTANVRYLTGIGGNGEEAICLFPLTGEPKVVLWSDMMREEWLEAQDWVTDIGSSRTPRWGRPEWSEAVSRTLAEWGLVKGRIGVVGLEGTEAQGDIPYPVLRNLIGAFPEVEFDNATDIVEDLRLIKSAEELVMLEEASRLGDLASYKLWEIAGPGVSERRVYSAMMAEMLEHGSENPIMFLWSAGAPARAGRLQWARGGLLKDGDVINTEYSPRFCGYYAHFQRPAFIGAPPDPYPAILAASVESYIAGREALKPGITVAELCRIMYAPIEKAGLVMYPGVLFHGMGLGWERPYGVPDSKVDMVFREGMVLGLEPGAASEDLKRGMHVGDLVVVTEDGCRSLSRTSSTEVPSL